MPTSRSVRESLSKSSWIRRMFEEGQRLKKEYGNDAVFDFSLGNPDLEPPPEFTRALERLVTSGEKGTHAYMPNAGFHFAREAIARKVSREHSCKVEADRVIMTTGAAGGLNVVLKAILEPGDEVIVPVPYFAEYASYVANHGGTLRPVPSGPDFSLDVRAVSAALSPRTAAVIVNSPNNPTGRIYSREDLLALSAALTAHGKASGRMPLLVADEPYRDILNGGRTVPAVLDLYPETVVVSSYSKSLSLPGERIGYVAASSRCADGDEFMAAMSMCNRILGFVNAPALMQRAVAELADMTFGVSGYEPRARLMTGILRDAGFEFPEPEGAFYVFCRAPGGDDVAFCMHLKESRILGVPGTGFGCPGWFRICYAVPERVIRASAGAFAASMAEWTRKG